MAGISGKFARMLWRLGKRGARDYVRTRVWEYARSEGCTNERGEINVPDLVGTIYAHAHQTGTAFLAAAGETALTMARILDWMAFCAIGIAARIVTAIVETTCAHVKPDGPTGCTRYRIRQIVLRLAPYEAGHEVIRALREAASDAVAGRRYEVVDEETGEVV